MKIFSLKRKTIPMVAVLVTGMAASIMVAVISPQAAQAFPTKGTGCTSCHTAGGSVTATPSTASVAPSAAYTVVLAFTGGSTPVGYAITGNGANVNASDAGPASMTAPAAVGSYTYTVWMRSGVVATTTYTITVAPVVTIPPTTVPPTTIPPTTIPPTTIPPTTIPPTTIPPTTTPPVTTPPISVGEDSLSPDSALGVSHLSMYNLKGANCVNCHDGSFVPAPPTITGDNINMEPGISCNKCHSARGEEDPLFISLMNNPTKVVNSRCSDCHVIASRGGSDGSDD